MNHLLSKIRLKIQNLGEIQNKVFLTKIIKYQVLESKKPEPKQFWGVELLWGVELQEEFNFQLLKVKVLQDDKPYL